MDLKLAIYTYLDRLQVDNYAEGTRTYRQIYLDWAVDMLRVQFHVTDSDELNKNNLQCLIDLVWKRKTRTGKPMAEASLISIFVSLRSFMAFLADSGYTTIDFSSMFAVINKRRQLFSNVVSESAIKRILAAQDITTHRGFRDRTLLEVLYGIGIRRSELLALVIDDLNFEEHCVFIHQGKGKKDRILPMGQRLEETLREYLEKVRPAFGASHNVRNVFVNNSGRPYTPELLTNRVKKISERCGVPFTCHTLRHSFATHLLKHGAGIVHIQRLLGHEQAGTTQIYAEIFPFDLKRIIQEKHPRNIQRLMQEEIRLPIQRINSKTSIAAGRLSGQKAAETGERTVVQTPASPQ